MRSIKTNPQKALFKQFLDLIWRDVQQNPSRLIPYTHDLDSDLDKLLFGVEVDTDTTLL